MQLCTKGLTVTKCLTLLQRLIHQAAMLIQSGTSFNAEIHFTYIYRMEKIDLLYAISRYLKDEKFQITLKALHRQTDKSTNNKKAKEQTVMEMFETHFVKHERKKLTFTYNSQNKRSQLRKRLLDQSDHTVNRKVKVRRGKERKNDIPDSFLLLLDQLGLDRKKAKLLYENKDQWSYVKSDMQLYCVEIGITNIALYTHNRLLLATLSPRLINLFINSK